LPHNETTNHETSNVIPAHSHDQLNKGDAEFSSNNLSACVDTADEEIYLGINILVAEDNLINQYVTQSMLETMGFSCVVADNGQIALDMINQLHIDLILMDCQMPVLDGFKATQQIRASETDRRLPIIALTANAMQEDAQKCFAAGMDSFLTKPIDKQLFEQTILDALEDLINERKSEQVNGRKAA